MGNQKVGEDGLTKSQRHYRKHKVDPAWMSVHREGRRARNARYREKNKEKVRFARRMYNYSRYYGFARGSFSFDEWQAMRESHEFRCAICKLKEPFPGPCSGLTIDHIVPLSRGGQNIVTNIQPLCLSCNMKKGNRVDNNYGEGGTVPGVTE